MQFRVSNWPIKHQEFLINVGDNSWKHRFTVPTVTNTDELRNTSLSALLGTVGVVWMLLFETETKELQFLTKAKVQRLWSSFYIFFCRKIRLLQKYTQNRKHVQTWILLILTLQFGATHAVSTHGTIRGRSQFQFPCPAIFGPSGWNVKDRTAEAMKLQRFCTFDRNLTRLLQWQIFTKFSFQVIKHLQQVLVGLERIIAGEPAPLFMVPFLKPASFGILIFPAQLLRFKSQIPSETWNLRQGTMSRSRSPW